MNGSPFVAGWPPSPTLEPDQDDVVEMSENKDDIQMKNHGLDVRSLSPRMQSTTETDMHHKRHWIFGVAHDIAISRTFSTTIMLVITFNLLMMGVEVDATSNLGPGEPTPAAFLVINVIIVVVFLFELVIKFLAYGPYNVMFGPDKWWNIFDIVIVLTSVIETVLEFAPVTAWMGGSEGTGVTRVV